MPRFRISLPAFLAAALLVAALTAAAVPAVAAPQGVADVNYYSEAVVIDVLKANDGVTLSVTGPIKYQLTRYYEPGERIIFYARDDKGNPLRDGNYRFEVRLVTDLSPSVRGILKEARASGDMTRVQELCDEGIIPLQASTAFGYLNILHGKIVYPDQEEERFASGEAVTPATRGTDLTAASGLASTGGLENVSAFDQVILDDLIVDGSACIGFDCVNGEVFSFDTLRLKENNLRIKFEDTSVGAFPTTDWQLTANDQAAGGANKFSIDDISGGRTPFTVEANAPSHSLYVDDGGRIGNGTSTPVAEFHSVDGDSPTLRLQQDASSGFAPQTWDIAGNETNFFVRDASNGSTLPFRIRPGAPSNSIFIDTDGDVGLGTSSPDTALHVTGGLKASGSDGDTDLLVEETSATEQARVMATLSNNGRVLWNMQDTSPNGTTWRFRTVEGQFNFDSDLGAGNELVLDSSGNLTILGTLAENSNREAKTNIENVDPQAVLDKVAQLPISTWTYKKAQSVAHLGPMAQDFHALFGLGATNTGITTYDTAGVALASIQALNRKVEEQQEELARKTVEIAALRGEKEALATELVERLEALEKALAASSKVSPED